MVIKKQLAYQQYALIRMFLSCEITITVYDLQFTKVMITLGLFLLHTIMKYPTLQGIHKDH